MGWSSGGELFDGALDVFLVHIPPYLRNDAVKKWYEAFKWTDWDTQQESKYYHDYLKGVMVKLGEIELCSKCGFESWDGDCENEECPESEYYEEPND